MTGKGSPQIPGANATNGGTLSIKMSEGRDNDVDSETEERSQLIQDRIRLKRNISATGNYTLSKVLQPTQSASQANLQAPSTADASENGKIARSTSVGVLKPSFNPSLDKMKKHNLTASNPIIGAPLGDKASSLKQLPKLQAGGGVPKGISQVQKLPNTGSQLSKSALVGGMVNKAAPPKYTVKKTIKFAKDIDGTQTPGANIGGGFTGGDL